MRNLIALFTVVLLGALCPSASAQTTVPITGRILDADTRMLLANIRVDVIDVASGDTLVANVLSDSLGRFAAQFSVSTGTDEFDTQQPDADRLTIGEPYPNPALEGAVTIPYSQNASPAPEISLELFDLLGRQLVPAEVHAAGVYLLRARSSSGDLSSARRFVKLNGGRVSFELKSVAVQRPARIAAGKGSQQAIRVVYSHPAYNDVESNVDSNTDLSALVGELVPRFTTEIADEQTFDVVYNPNAIIIADAARSSLVEADTVNQRYRFDTSGLATAGITLVDGSPILIEGVALRRITGISIDGDQTVVETEFAPITDVVESGTISWNHAAKFDQAALRKTTVAGKPGTYDPESESAIFAYQSGAYEIKIRVTSAPSDTVRAKVEVQVTKTVDNQLKATFTGTADLRDFESSGDLSFANNETEAVDIENKNVRVDMTLTLAAAGSGLDGFNWKMPEVGIPIRFMVGPVPIVVNVKVQVVLNMTILNEASATASTKLSYNGTTGFSYDGTDASMSHETINSLLGSTSTDAGATIGNVVDANLGIAFPRVSVNIFAVPIVPSFLVGFVVGSKLAWGPVCKSGYVTAEVKASIDLEFFSLTHTLAERELWKDRKDSPPC